MSGEDVPTGREEPANVATAGVEASNSAGEGSPEAVPEKVASTEAGAPIQPAEPVEEKKPEVAQSSSNAAEAGAAASPAEPVEEKKPEAAATEEPSIPAEVPTQAAEPVEEKKPEATATEAGEASPTAEVGPTPSTQPVEEKPEAAATEEPSIPAEVHFHNNARSPFGFSSFLHLQLPPQVGQRQPAGECSSEDGGTSFIWKTDSASAQGPLECSGVLSVEMQEGYLHVFPQWVQHFVWPFRGSGERRTIAANIARLPPGMRG